MVWCNVPDFIVVKAGFEYGGDLALAVIEVKKREGLMVGSAGSDSVIYAQHFPQETHTQFEGISCNAYLLQLPMGENLLFTNLPQ